MELRFRLESGGYSEATGNPFVCNTRIHEVAAAPANIVAIEVEDPSTVIDELSDGEFFEVWSRDGGFDQDAVTRMNELYGLPV